MQPDLLWNIGGIPPEAREAARAAARREGLPVGEWLTRRILRPASNTPPKVLALPERWRPSAAANADSWHNSDMDPGASPPHFAVGELLRDPGSRPNLLQTDVQPGRIAQRPDTVDGLTSRSRQGVDSEARSDLVLREQVDAFTRLDGQVAALAARLDQFELRSTGDAIKDAVKALHAGLVKLAEQTAQATRQANTHMTALSEQVDSLSSRIELANCQMEITALQVKDEVMGLAQRLDVLEGMELGEATTGLRRSIRELGSKLIEAENAHAGQLASLKKGVSELTTHIANTQIDTRIAQLDRRVSELAPSDDDVQVAQRLSDELSRLARRLDMAEDAYRQGLAQLRERLTTTQAQSPPMPPIHAERAEFDASAPRGPHHASDFEAAQAISLPSSPSRAGRRIQNFDTAAELPVAGRRRDARTTARWHGSAHGQSAFPATNSKSDPGRLRNIAMTSIVVLLFALAAAYLLYRQGTAASLSPPYGTTRSIERPSAHLTPRSQLANAVDTFAFTRVTPHRRVADKAIEAQNVPSSSAHIARASEPITTARSALTARATQGDANAETELGLDYLKAGTGFRENEAQAARWLERAAKQGQPFAQFRLATLYARGHGVPANPQIACAWYEAAARQGNRRAMHNLAVAYAQGNGVAVDYERAAHWFAAAARLGFPASEFDLAILYERGLGVPRSLVNAYTWYSIAAAQGDNRARAVAASLGHRLSNAELSRAERAAVQFVPAPLDIRANQPPTTSRQGS